MSDDVIPNESNQDMRAEQVAVVVMLGWVLVVALIMYHGYRGAAWSEALIFRVNDGWCKPRIESIGAHCFGDFGLAYNRGGLGDIYVPNNFAVTGTPLTLALFEFLRLVPYRLSLAIFILTSLGLITAVCWDALKRSSRLVQVSITVFCGWLSYGTLTALDRGNHVILLVAPAYYLLASHKSRSNLLQVLLLAILIGLKFWGVIFVVPLLASKRYSVVALGMVLGILTYVVPISFFTGEYFAKWRLMLSSISSPDIAAITAPYNLSFNGLVQRMSCLVRTHTWCDTNSPAANYEFQQIVTILVCLSVLALVFATTKYLPNHQNLTIPFALVMPIVAIPDAAPYVTVFAIPALAAFLKFSPSTTPVSRSERGLGEASVLQQTTRVLQYALVVSVVPVPLYFVTTNMFASSNGQSSPVFRIQYWVIPVAWLFVSLFLARLLYLTQKNKRKTLDVDGLF